MKLQGVSNKVACFFFSWWLRSSRWDSSSRRKTNSDQSSEVSKDAIQWKFIWDKLESKLTFQDTQGTLYLLWELKPSHGPYCLRCPHLVQTEALFDLVSLFHLICCFHSLLCFPVLQTRKEHASHILPLACFSSDFIQVMSYVSFLSESPVLPYTPPLSPVRDESALTVLVSDKICGRWGEHMAQKHL